MGLLDQIASELKKHRDAPIEGLPTESFRQISPLKNGEKIMFVDGGSGVILSTPSYALALVRLCAITYEGSKKSGRTDREFFCHARLKEGNILVDFFGMEAESLQFQKEEKTIPESYIDLVRKIFELRLARELADDLDVLVLDGDLEAESLFEDLEFQKLKEICKQSSILLCALSKTNRYTKQDASIVQLLQVGMQKGRWFYPLNRKTCFTKLHPRSQYIFRLDTLDPERAAPILSAHAHDPVFLGYPYGLVAADTHARVSFKEIERLRLILTAKVGNRDELSALDAHGVLDRINSYS